MWVVFFAKGMHTRTQLITIRSENITTVKNVFMEIISSTKAEERDTKESHRPTKLTDLYSIPSHPVLKDQNTQYFLK